jgi:hypothetical protein
VECGEKSAGDLELLEGTQYNASPLFDTSFQVTWTAELLAVESSAAFFLTSGQSSGVKSWDCCSLLPRSWTPDEMMQ